MTSAARVPLIVPCFVVRGVSLNLDLLLGRHHGVRDEKRPSKEFRRVFGCGWDGRSWVKEVEREVVELVVRNANEVRRRSRNGSVGRGRSGHGRTEVRPLSSSC